MAALTVDAVGCDRVWPTGSVGSMSVSRDQVPLSSAVTKPPDQVIGAIARRVAIRSRPSPKSAPLGFLTAGATLKRSSAPVATQGCPGGWYSVPPTGYVCLDEQTTIDPNHPTLQARGLSPNREADLPYPYAAARRTLALYEPDPNHRDGVRERGRLATGSTFAIVGSWETLDDYDQRQRLAMLTLGVFVPTRDIEPVKTAGGASKDESARAAEGVRQPRALPEFAASQTHWIDVDLTRGIIVFYVGERQEHVIFARSLPGESIQRGTAKVRTKQITDLTSGTPGESNRYDYDSPWIIELDSGITLRASVDVRSGQSEVLPHTIELHPGDAARLFRFVHPEVPDGWHAIVADRSQQDASIFRLR
jgi:hypothetical protein